MVFWLAVGAPPTLPPPTLPAPAARPPTPAALSIAAPAAATEPARAEAAFTIDFAPVLTDGGLRVLLRGEVKDRQVTGPPVVSEDDGVTIVTRTLGEAGRAEVADVVGATLRLYRADGRSCRARVTGAVALARLDPGGSLEPSDDPQAAWDAAPRSHVIAGDLEPHGGDCDHVLWARSESLPAPAVASPGVPTSAVRRAVLAALKARPEYRELAGDSGIASEAVEVTTLSAGDETVAVATLLGEGCAGPEPLLTALWRVAPGGALRFLGAEETITAILGGADVDGDGRIEIIGRDDIAGVAVLRRKAGRFRVDQRAEVSMLGCRC